MDLGSETPEQSLYPLPSQAAIQLANLDQSIGVSGHGIIAWYYRSSGKIPPYGGSTE
jgi:hypothetical protein